MRGGVSGLVLLWVNLDKLSELGERGEVGISDEENGGGLRIHEQTTLK